MAVVGGAALASLVMPVGIAGASVGSTPPHIVAQPDNVMVNSVTTLTGSGFPAASTIQLRECGKRIWIADKNPCDTTNAVSVTTNASGGFRTPFKVELCPRGAPGPQPTSQICYIGEPKPSGVDTIHLIGAAKVTVTYP